MPTKTTRSYDSVDSNWTFMYVVLSLIPVAFVAVAVLSTRRDKAIQREKSDMEMAIVRRQTWPPWRKATSGPKRSGEPHGQYPYVTSPPRVVTNPPIPPRNFGRSVKESDGEEIDRLTRDRDFT
ncbi:uncharacterized protein GGS22DRAFT_195471 [Annulohypoxylon maeteangense]|uniref:uncharacterized protein n=1 Tax=Annulohypoxylon maeteangense TaxID=1927788 RepID=UPI002007A666|nr:uncharacterized protein GGS22DRAFT_195471 [Annulohypoxylon maeteangense]KAI0883321.1 hypothetical protein GGS22DRAFT_195471 [Annulohypoxylon maeteangense]